MTKQREDLMIRENDEHARAGFPATEHLYLVTFSDGTSRTHLAPTKMAVYGHVAAYDGPERRDSITDIVVVG